MSARPLITVYDALTGEATKKSLHLPAVFTTPIRPDVVNIVHTNMNKNHRQPYAVSPLAGHQTSAESWGTGRAVSRIPRVAGGGTHASGQGAYGNMCRGGHMYSPTKIWRRWHRKVNVGMKRYAVCSALAASAVPALVAARGHRIGKINEIPLVVSAESLAKVEKTKKAVEVLKKLNAYDDIQKVIDSKHIRPGRGKCRNRKYVQRLGPIIIYKEKSNMVRAFRNIPGIEFQNVERLNLLRLAPGGHLGRFIIWTDDAFAALDTIYGTYKAKSIKRGFHLPYPKMTNTDLARIMRSEEIQKYLRAKKHNVRASFKRNPLKNKQALARLNPAAIAHKRAVLLARIKAEHPSKIAKKNAPKVVSAAEKAKAKAALKKKLRAQHIAFSKKLLA